MHGHLNVKFVTLCSYSCSIQNIMHFANTFYLPILHESHNKQWWYPYSAFVFYNWRVCSLRGTSWIFKHNSGYL